MTLTIAEVAGLINVGVVLLQFTYPLILIFILVGITAHTNNAATWSVTGRLLSGTWWPTILRTDAAAQTNVNKKVIFISMFSTLGLVLLAAATVLTPLGLFDVLIDTTTEAADFTYTRDLSAIGLSTFNRDNHNISRICGSLMYKPCPGQYHGFTWYTNDTGSYMNSDSADDYISTAMPDNLTEIFSSGRLGDMKTVATPFDIQFRAYTLHRDPDQTATSTNGNDLKFNIDQQRPRTVGAFKNYDNFLSVDGFVIQDGIVADMKRGGIGFRNHTLPNNAALGARWSENLLWIEPQTVCLKNNMSIQFRTPMGREFKVTPNLIDEGGLLTIQRGVDYPEYDYEHSEINTELYARAYKGATLMNYNVAAYLNISSKYNETYIGRRFSLINSAGYIPGRAVTGSFDQSVPSSSLDWDLPRNSSRKLMKSIDLLVQGYGGIDVANISRIAVTGGVVLGAPLKMSTDSTIREDPGSNYTAPVLSCATALKAYVMNVTFSFNGTSDLKNLRVRSTAPRSYNASLPLWAIEKPDDRFFVADMDSLWGIVDDKYENDTRFWTFRRDHLYLPAGSGSFSFDNLFASDSLAAASPENILSTLYPVGPGSDPDYYGGKYSLPLQQKWMNMSQSSDTIPTMMSLLWTDIAINTLTSRRSQLNAGFPSVTTADDGARQQTPASVALPVTQYHSTIRYKPVFAIPAFMFLFIYIIGLITALAMRCLGRSNLGMLRSLLNQTSVGRAILAERYDTDHCNTAARIKTMNTGEWIGQYGLEDIEIRKDSKYRYKRLELNELPSKSGVYERTESIDPPDEWDRRVR